MKVVFCLYARHEKLLILRDMGKEGHLQDLYNSTAFICMDPLHKWHLN